MYTSKKYNYIKIAKHTEIAAIYAAIQNMILMAKSLDIGSCWLHVPLFFKKEINLLLKEKGDLVAMLTLGYPAEKGHRAPREAISETVRYL